MDARSPSCTGGDAAIITFTTILLKKEKNTGDGDERVHEQIGLCGFDMFCAEST